ncbi:MAG: hypothetical protein LBQ24_06160 [Candidatus Peribacteria bacterium]|nr:hypothetical protein [Candidatus Peribacteria bacterium]
MYTCSLAFSDEKSLSPKDLFCFISINALSSVFHNLFFAASIHSLVFSLTL